MKKNGARILVVDEELEIVRLLQHIFTMHEYRVFTTVGALDTLHALAYHRPDLLLLGLDGHGSGLAICQQVRAQSGLPIIALSANGRVDNKVHALDLGADDYICKPFGVQELLARVRVALRHAARLSSGVGSVIAAGPLTIDVARRLVLIHEREVKLTPTEYDLLKVFITHRNKIMSRQVLLSQVWGTGDGRDFHYLHVFIAQLRRKIEVNPSSPRLIVSIPGVGYRFSCEQEHSA